MILALAERVYVQSELLSRKAERKVKTSIKDHEGNKYLRTIYSAVDPGIPCIVDVYAVLKAFNVTCPARQHAIKKLLCAGLRDKGSQLDDMRGALAAVNRAVELAELEDPTWPRKEPG